MLHRKVTLGSACVVVVLVILFFVAGSAAEACETFASYGVTACVDLYVSAYVRLPSVTRTLFNATSETFSTSSADNIEFQNNQAFVTLDGAQQAVSDALGFSLRWHLRVNPFWDTTYSLPGTAGQGKYPFLADQLETNLNGRMADQYSPLVREAYVDLSPGNFFIRIGRQIIPWGKSDGVYMLDILNNFNLVNPESFNEQNIKIPEWAANINWNVSATGTVQAVVIPQYLPTYYAGAQIQGGYPVQGGYGDFTYNSIALVNNELNGSIGFKTPTRIDFPSPSRLNNWVYAARWSDQLDQIHYTLNYVYTWTTSMIYYPNTGTYATADEVLFHPHRMHVAGGSLDYDIDIGNRWLDGTVLRAESAVTAGDTFYAGSLGNPVDVTHWGFLGGVDKTILTDYLEKPIFFSAQYWQDWVIARNNSCACGPFSNDYQWTGFYGGHSGTRGPYYSIATLFMDKTWLPGDFLDTSLAVVYEWQFQDWWIRPQVGYQIDDKTWLGVGFDIFAGGPQTPYGEFTNATNIYFELHRALF